MMSLTATVRSKVSLQVTLTGRLFVTDRFSGTYTVKANCTGTVTFKDGAATQGDMFIAPDGSMFAFVRTTPEDVAAGIDPQVTAKRVGE